MSEENEGSQELTKVERGTLKARDIKIGAVGINFTNAAEVMAFANMMASAGPAVRKQFRDQPGACLAIIDDAIRFGMSPFFLARKAYLVNDEIAYEAQVLAAIIIARAPIQDRPEYEFSGEGPDLKCVVTVTTATGKIIKHASPRIAEIKPQNSPLWKSDPPQQLGYYTVRAMARRHFPDILGGIYDVEEAASARARDITPSEPGERPKSKLGEMLEAGKAAKTAEIEERLAGKPKDAPKAESPTEQAKPAEDAPAANSEAPADVPRETSTEGWSAEETDILDKLVAALAKVTTLEGLDPLGKEFGTMMKGKRKAFVEHANELVTKRREELTPKKESAARRML
jgi:hypothetical protein